MRAIPTSGSERRAAATCVPRVPHRHSLSERLATMLFWLERQLERRRSRRALLRLNDDQLKDIGLSRADADREASRPFWD
jgi:uncharacterized protein YjiS (DUF1127 family)